MSDQGVALPPQSTRDIDRTLPASLVEIDVNKLPSAIKPLRNISLPATTAPAVTLWLGMTVSNLFYPLLTLKADSGSGHQ